MCELTVSFLQVNILPQGQSPVPFQLCLQRLWRRTLKYFNRLSLFILCIFLPNDINILFEDKLIVVSMSMSNYSCEGECRAKAKTASVEKSDVEPLQFHIQVYIFDKFFFHESFKYLVP